ncbi:MAG: DsbA family protein [Anaerolineaceae bacterium]|nr:MAG: DsbA family protein [Anaerolineaceae bacterium]
MNKEKQKQYILFGGVAAVMVAALAIAISLLNTGNISRANVDYSELGFSRTDDGAFVLGNPDAPITIVEFADFQCPYCQEYKSTMDRVVEELVAEGLVQYEFRVFPVLGQASTYYAQLLECTGEMIGDEGFWLAHTELFVHASQRRSGDQAARALAEELNISYASLLECTGEAQQYQTNLSLGRSAQVQGTPAVRIRYNGGELMPVRDLTRAGIPFEELRQLVMDANS